MKELVEFELDILFRIDFFALINYEEDLDLNDEKFQTQKEELKNKLGFERYFERESGGYEYVKLGDFIDSLTPYLKYLLKLEERDVLRCCQLEQAIGILQDEKLIAFLSTDSGLCFNLDAHFYSVMDSLESGESDWSDINTYHIQSHGKWTDLHYSPDSNNVDISESQNLQSYKLYKEEFIKRLKHLKSRVNPELDDICANAILELNKEENREFIREVLKGIS